jgi:hypothetical protein
VNELAGLMHDQGIDGYPPRPPIDNGDGVFTGS